jgi:hypothetical protein
MSPFRPVILKSHRHPGDSTDPDGVAGAAGLGIDRVHVEKRGGGGRNPAGQAEHFERVADQVGGLGGERAGRAVQPSADQAAVRWSGCDGCLGEQEPLCFAQVGQAVKYRAGEAGAHPVIR